MPNSIGGPRPSTIISNVANKIAPKPAQAQFSKQFIDRLEDYLAHDFDPTKLTDSAVSVKSLPAAAQKTLASRYGANSNAPKAFKLTFTNDGTPESHDVYVVKADTVSGFEGPRNIVTNDFNVFRMDGSQLMFGSRTPDPDLVLSSWFTWTDGKGNPIRGPL